MNQRLSITALLTSPIVINDDLYFDGILYNAIRDREVLRKPRKEIERQLFVKLPIARKNKCYLASKARYKIFTQYIDKWRKRFETLKAEKWKDKQKIRTDSTKYKNYNMPIQVTIPKDMKINWIVVGDKKEIEKILNSIYAIGKKTSQGYGMIRGWQIEETTKKGVRHFPVMHESNLSNHDIMQYVSFCPPYATTNKHKCIIRKF